MWLTKVLYKIQLWWIANYYTAEQKNQKYLAHIRILKPSLFKRYTVASGCMFGINVIFPNMETYIRRLKYINHLLEDNRHIQNDWCRYDYVEITLEKFFTNSNSIYSDPIEVVELFKKEYETYCNSILLIENKKLGEEEHNLRILTEYSSHLNAITLDMIRFTMN